MKDGEDAEKFLSLDRWRESALYTRRERLALEAAEGMTVTGRDVSDDLFRELRAEFTDEELVELAATIALENYRSKFNHFFRVEANGLCKWEPPQSAAAEKKG
ncbi:MAG: carboxymuconolactone decarboxylase family protein [Candidatus Tectomicrobia bacterium]|nr:carboxymuconolactone decarboxylase family protein [Candidatus Tectomicrobia bacterium]